MKRLHVHLAVDDLQKAITFYSTLFAASPTTTKPDYAKWMLDDPRVNFAISARGGRPGIQHLGIQAEDKTELDEVYERLSRAGAQTLEEGETTCCYARSEKSWVADPVGTNWEVFRTMGESTDYGHDLGEAPETAVIANAPHKAGDGGCCTPKAAPRPDGQACCG